jgi:hypothetical protein
MIISSGEALQTRLGDALQRLFPGVTILNLYGTTEVWKQLNISL